MRVKAVLIKKKNNSGECPIAIYIYQKSKVYHYLKFSVKESDFNEFSGLVKYTRANHVEINRVITNTKNDIEKLLIEYSKLSAKEVLALYLGGGGGLVSFANQFIKESKGVKKATTIQTYKSTLRNLEYFNSKIEFSSINRDFYNNFCHYLRSRNFKPNSIGKNIKVLKVFLNEAFDRGLTTSQEHRKKYFVAQKVEVDSVYLNEEEIKLIENVDLSNNPDLQAERDRFIVSYYFLLRYSDSIKISKDSIFEMNGKRFIKLRTTKTNNEVVIPIKPSVYEALERNEFSFKENANSESNWKIKEVCKIAGVEKYLQVTTHTARRSGATNLYIQSIKNGTPPVKLIMELGGWKKENLFKLYIRVDKLESAIMAADLDFFK